MAKRRRFRVDSLEGARAGARVPLSSAERRHLRVLRLKPGAALELFDGEGRAWHAVLDASGTHAKLNAPAPDASPSGAPQRERLILAAAWPKGRRAALLVEKCTELGVSRIVPLCCERGVVRKQAVGQGLARLRRIAEQAAKQSGRNDVPEIGAERPFEQVLLEDAAQAEAVVLDPRAPKRFVDWLAEKRSTPRPPRPPRQTGRPWLCLVGPEGGFSGEEMRRAEQAGLPRASLGPHTLRVETACIAACAIWAAEHGGVTSGATLF